MDALSWWQKVGTPAAKAAAEEAGTTWGYFRLIARRFKRPSVDLAMRLSKASRGRMKMDDLLIPGDQVRRSPSQLKKSASRNR
jgi:hypothetical protein